jgi:hypothetical protein
MEGYTTTCPSCGKLYQEPSREYADDPNRSCYQCWRKKNHRRERQARLNNYGGPSAN